MCSPNPLVVAALQVGLLACVAVSGVRPAAASEAEAGAGEADEEQPLYLRIDTPPAPILTPEQALETFKIAPGFRIELVVAEPLIEDPVAITWDEAGAMYVAEMRGYMPDSYGTGQTEPVGTVVRLTDRDADGRMDHREVLMDALVLPRAVAVVNEGLLVAEPPNLWLCPSATGRGKDIDCEKRRSLGAYGDQPGSVEHAENGLLPGLDNWLYSAKSGRRLRVRDGALEEQATLFRGQWGITQDNEGRLYYNTNSNLLSGDFFPAESVVAAGTTAAPGLNARINADDALYSIRVNTGVNRAYVPGVLRDDGRLAQPTSASGMVAYRGDQFPAAHQRDIYVTEPAANVVVRLVARDQDLAVHTEHVLYPDSEWGQREFLASTDERFRPINAGVGPDGALYIVDFYRGIIQDHVFISEELRAQVLARGLDRPLGMGRVWRIVHASRTPDVYRDDLATASDERLVELLGHENGWRRDVAQRLLKKRSGEAVDRLLQRALIRGDGWQAVHALWTLAGRGSLDRATVLAAARSEHAELSRQAVHAGAGILSAQDLLELAELRGDDARYQQNMTLAFAGHNASEAVQERLQSVLLASLEDPYRRVAVQAALRGREVDFLRRLVAGDAWSLERESATGFVEKLARQSLAVSRESPRVLAQALDTIAAQPADRRWLQRAMLQGFFDATRIEGFERVQLAQAHQLFTDDGVDEDLWPAISRARRAFTWPGDDLAAELKPLTPAQRARMTEGARYFATYCATCHGTSGQGIASLGPPLAGSAWVTESAERLARIVLHGLQGPITVGDDSWNGVMPGHAHVPEFSDAVASGLLTFLNRSWGHTGRAIEPGFVSAIRADTADRSLPWTAAELGEIAINTHYAAYAGEYGSPQFPLSFAYQDGALHIQSAILNGVLVETKEDHFLFEPRQLALEFERDDDNAVQAVWMRGGGSDNRLPRLGAR